jgi:hypothetical protein
MLRCSNCVVLTVAADAGCTTMVLLGGPPRCQEEALESRADLAAGLCGARPGPINRPS